MNLKKYISELKRRNVFKAGIAYLLLAWLLIQILGIVLPTFNAPSYLLKTILFIIGIGFPFWLVFAWVFEITPEGIKKTEAVEEKDSITPKTGYRLSKVIIASLLLVIIILLFDHFKNNSEKKLKSDKINQIEKSGEQRKKAIAVLAFLNHSKNANDDYLADGITEAITLELGKNDSLRVISRTSAMSFKNAVKLSSEIAVELETDYLLEGSVLIDNDSIKVTVQLIEPLPKEKHVWSKTYKQKFENILQLEMEISIDIANEIINVVSPLHAKYNKYKVNGSAYDLYLKGRHLWNQQTENSIVASIEYLKESIKLDSTYALAYVTLAEDYIALNRFITDNEEKPLNREKSRNAINKALELDDTLGAAYITKGNVFGKFDWNWNGMKTMLEKGLKLDPNNAYGHILLSDYYLVKSDFEMAIKETLFAEKLDPLNPMIGTILGLKYGMANNYEKANTQFNKVLECFPNYPAVWSELGFIQFINGQKTAAQNSWKRFQEIQGNEVMVKLYMEQPLEDGLKYWLAEVKKKSPKYCSYPTLIAQVYMLLLDKDEALNYLEIAYKYKNEYLPLMLFRPDFNSLHNEPRFKALVKKTGIILHS
jgi:adenylate cyclase